MCVFRKSKVVRRGNESILSVKSKKLDLITKASEFDEYILVKKPGVSFLRHEKFNLRKSLASATCLQKTGSETGSLAQM